MKRSINTMIVNKNNRKKTCSLYIHTHLTVSNHNTILPPSAALVDLIFIHRYSTADHTVI